MPINFYREFRKLIHNRDYQAALELLDSRNVLVGLKSTLAVRKKLIEYTTEARLTNGKAQSYNESTGNINNSNDLFSEVQSNIPPRAINKSHVLLNELPSIANGWKREFHEGVMESVHQESGLATSVSVLLGRDFLSKCIQLTPNRAYEVSVDCHSLNGEHQDILTVITPVPLDGDMNLLGSSDLNGQAGTIAFLSTDESAQCYVRIGVGVSSSCKGPANIIFGTITIKESKYPETNRHLIKNIDLHQYIDPKLVIPLAEGLGNDYSFIETNREELLKKDNWQRLSVSVVIPIWGSFRFLENTLAALCCQTYPRNLIEVIIVDDGNNESLDAIFNSFSQKLNLYWARQPHNGFGLARARNLGARSARNDVLLFLDSDILLPSEFINQMMSYHHVNQFVSVLGIRNFVFGADYTPDIILEDPKYLEMPRRVKSSNPHFMPYVDSNGVTFDWRLNEFAETNWLKSSDKPFCYFNGGHSSVLRTRFQKVGGVDESFSNWGNEDRELAYRLQMDGQYFIPLKDPFDLHQEDNGDNKLDQIYKISENEITQILLTEKCAHPTIQRSVSFENYSVPRFSIYIPAYNAEAFIEQAIESALAQTFLDLEIVVVDDGSTDNTWKLLQNRYSNNSKVRLFKKTNGGIASASNHALRNCRGHFVCQLDSDDILMPNAVETVFEFFTQNSDIDCIYSNFGMIDSEGNNLGEGWAPKMFCPYEMLVGMSIPHLRVFKRQFFSRIDGFDETIVNAVDYDFYLKLSRVARISHIDQILYMYRIHRKQTSSAKKREQITNHVKVVRGFLRSIGLGNFEVKKLNPLEPQRNYIYDPMDKFGDQLLKRLEKLRQNELPVDLTFPLPKVVGNDYSYIESFVKNYYARGNRSYSLMVSIVVPAYNRAERLSRCLAGLFHQTYPRKLIEIIVVDDGSSDEILAVVKKYEKLFDLKYVKQIDDGYRLSAARNLGIRAASHENICIIDCDLIPLRTFIESFMQYLHHFDNVILLGHQRFVDPTGITDDQIIADYKVLDSLPDIVAENETMERTSESAATRDWRYSLYDQTDYLKNDEFPYRAFSSGHVAYHKDAIKIAGMYDEEFNVWGCEDNEAGYRLYNKGYIFLPVLEAVDLHQEPPSGKNETDRTSDRIFSRQLLQGKCPPMRGWFGGAYELKESDVPLVSVCVPAYNVEQFIGQAIESVLVQTLPDIEVLVYDDGSTDNTIKVVEGYCKKDSRVRLILGRENIGVTGARDTLIRCARGEFVGFLDSDDLLEPTCLSKCINAFRGKPDVGLLCTGYTVIDEGGQFVRNGWIPTEFDRKGLFFGNIFTHFRMFRVRDWSRSIRWSDDDIKNIRYGEDWDLCLRLVSVSNFIRLEEPLYRYRLNGSSITRTHTNNELADQHRYVATKLLQRLGCHNYEVVSIDVDRDPHLIGYVKTQFSSFK